VEEQLVIFMAVVGKRGTNRSVQETFQRSGEIIHRHIHAVLAALLDLFHDRTRQLESWSCGCWRAGVANGVVAGAVVLGWCLEEKKAGLPVSTIKVLVKPIIQTYG
jgi:hypothetical protein